MTPEQADQEKKKLAIQLVKVKKENVTVKDAHTAASELHRDSIDQHAAFMKMLNDKLPRDDPELSRYIIDMFRTVWKIVRKDEQSRHMLKKVQNAIDGMQQDIDGRRVQMNKLISSTADILVDASNDLDNASKVQNGLHLVQSLMADVQTACADDDFDRKMFIGFRALVEKIRENNAEEEKVEEEMEEEVEEEAATETPE